MMPTAPTARVTRWWYLLPVLSGWLLSLASPLHNLTACAWVALVPLFVFLGRCQRPGPALRGAWLAGLIYFLLIIHPFTTLIWWGWAQSPSEYRTALMQQRLFLSLWHPLTAVWCSAWWGLWGVGFVWLTRSSRVRVWLAAGLWIVLCEYGRSWAFFDFTWGALGYATHPLRTLRQLSALTGVMGLSALIVLVNAWLAHVVLLWLARPSGGGLRTVARQPREWGLAVSVALTLALAWGAAASWGRTLEAQPDGTSVSVAALQAGKRKYYKKEFERSALDWTYAPLLRAALERGAKLLVLPEAVWLAKIRFDESPLPDTLSRYVTPQEVVDYLAPQLAPAGASALIGFDVGEQGRVYNTMLAWEADGMVGRYEKRRLTPFAEYPPGVWRHLAPKGRIVFTPGRGSQLMTVQGIRVAGFICQEVLFPHLARQSVRDGAQLLVADGNDGIFKDPAVARGHHIAALFRAIETGRPMVRAMKTGISSIINARGRVIALAPVNRMALLTAELRLSRVVTPYVRWGEWLVALAAIGLLAAGACRLRRGRDQEN